MLDFGGETIGDFGTDFCGMEAIKKPPGCNCSERLEISFRYFINNIWRARLMAVVRRR